MLPNFLYIGPDKSGSSWLHVLLRSHSKVYVPSFKDIYFFDRYYDRGIDWYAGLFADCPADKQAVGEISHDYLFSPAAARRISEHIHGVRLLTILRDPVDRTFSQYLYFVRSGRTRVPFEEALEQFPELTNNSRYYQHLSVYFELFDREQIGVFWFSDLQRDARGFAESICAFLGIEFEPDLEYAAPVRQASRARSTILARMAKRGANLARGLGLPRLVGAVKHGAAGRWLFEPYKDGERPVINPATAADLRELYKPDVMRLQELLGTSLDSWLPAEPEATA